MRSAAYREMCSVDLVIVKICDLKTWRNMKSCKSSHLYSMCRSYVFMTEMIVFGLSNSSQNARCDRGAFIVPYSVLLVPASWCLRYTVIAAQQLLTTDAECDARAVL